MTEKSIKALLKEQPLNVEIGRIVKEVRFSKELTQQALCEKVGISTLQLSDIENARTQRVDLEVVKKLLSACGETLLISCSYDNPLQITDQTEKEDAVLTLFSEGKTEEAEAQLSLIRGWRYPSTHLTAQCKRNMAIAISYHFKGMRGRSQLRMNDLLMGLSFIGCPNDAERFIEMYHRIIKQGDACLLRANEEVRS